MSKIIIKDAHSFKKYLDNTKKRIDEMETEANNCTDATRKKVCLELLTKQILDTVILSFLSRYLAFPLPQSEREHLCEKLF